MTSLGIVTRYRPDECTQAALAVADVFLHAGASVSVYARPGASQRLYPAWDHKIIRGPVYDLASWLSCHTHVLWMEPPHEMWEVAYASTCGAHTAVAVPADCLTVDDLPYLLQFDRRVTGSADLSRRIAKASCHAVTTWYIPWAVPVPTIAPKTLASGEPVHVCFPFADSQDFRITGQDFCFVCSLLQEEPAVEVGILHNRWMPQEEKRLLHALQRDFPGRIHLCSKQDPILRHRFIAAHHLTVWPARYEGFGLTGLYSLQAGVPVVAGNCPPMNEVLSRRNSLLLSCNTHDFVVSSAIDLQYAPWTQAILQLVRDRPRLNAMAQECHLESEARRDAFRQGWLCLWNP